MDPSYDSDQTPANAMQELRTLDEHQALALPPLVEQPNTPSPKGKSSVGTSWHRRRRQPPKRHQMYEGQNLEGNPMMMRC